MKSINKLKKKHKFTIYEDAAHSFGAQYDKKNKVGSCKYSDMTVFSFSSSEVQWQWVKEVVSQRIIKKFLKDLSKNKKSQ